MIRAIGFLVSEFLWTLVFRITGDTPTPDDMPQPPSEQARVRTEWGARAPLANRWERVMSDWKIEVRKVKAEDVTTHALLVDFLESSRAWKRLSKSARAAVEAAYPDKWIVAHPLTRRALVRHGFVMRSGPTGWKLTEAGKAVAKWCVK